MLTSLLHGKSVLVTGGASGLGKAIARAYLKAGANVSICDTNESRLSAARNDFGPTGRFLAMSTDISDESAVRAMTAQAASKFGRLDILVNNAAIPDHFDPIGDLSKQVWDRVLNVNLTGSFLCMQAAVNHMQNQSPQGGTIIQIGRNASTRGLCGGLAYTVSKHGVAALVKHTAGFYGDQGISAIGLMVGYMHTEMGKDAASAQHLNHAAFTKSAAALPLQEGDAVDVADIAKFCVFLGDNQVAATVNGSCLPLNRNWPKA
ncbi:hypothetical protein G7054_g5737 [Neopestalotiopsis clavispora]|nr:hypothetical protein G7054_g5737 [Neopestalotiopsis clavispora]